MDQHSPNSSALATAIAGKPEPDVIVPDAKTIKEIRGLTRTPTGAFKAKSGHEDHYDALTIALCIARDSFSGLHRQQRVVEDAQRNEFEARFAAINRPLIMEPEPPESIVPVQSRTKSSFTKKAFGECGFAGIPTNVYSISRRAPSSTAMKLHSRGPCDSTRSPHRRA